MDIRRVFVIIIIFIHISFSFFGQISGTGYSITLNPPLPKGCSQSDMEEYFTTNRASLNPIEGLYDLSWQQRTLYKNYPPRISNDSYTVGIIRGGKYYYIYAPFNQGYSPQTWVLIEPIGDTPLYNFMLLSSGSNNSSVQILSKERVLLEEGLIWEYSHSLTRDENASMGNEQYGITGTDRRLSAVKFFPVSSSTKEESKQWTGTGFALKDKYIVTNYHVIDGANEIQIFGINGDFNKSYNAVVAGFDKTNDLALLKVADSQSKGFLNIPYSINTTTSDVGEDIYVLGYPLTTTMGDEVKLTTGVISSKTGFQGDVALYQISAPIQPGNSGGPLFDKNGNVIGIVSAKHAGAENVGYAIKTLYLRNLIESCASSSIIPTANPISSLSLAGKVKVEKNFVFLIKCSSDK